MGTEAPAAKCASGKTYLAGQCFTSKVVVALNSVGFLPSRAKTMTIIGKADSFDVYRVDTSTSDDAGPSSPVYSGTTKTSTYSGDDGKSVTVSVGDFSALTDPGQYIVVVPGMGLSPQFQIGQDAYAHIFQGLMLGMLGWRCGTEVALSWNGVSYSHAACHQNDAWLDYYSADSTHEHKDSKRGWHDAGDYGKYIVNAAISIGTMLDAWLHFHDALASFDLAVPEHGQAPVDYLAELKWELDWMLTAQDDAGRASHKVTSLGFGKLEVMPEADLDSRYFAPWGSIATADEVGALALASRAYADTDAAYAAQLLDAAKKGYSALLSNPGHTEPNQKAFSTGTYSGSDNGDAQARLWAAAELWETTGDPDVLADLETRIAAAVPKTTGKVYVEPDFDWDQLSTLGYVTYVLSSRSGRDPDLVNQTARSFVKGADSLVQSINKHVYGRANDTYYWGYNGRVARFALTLQTAYRLSGNSAYLDAAVHQVDWLLGRNQYVRSQVTGLGYTPPAHPHHRPSAATGRAWPGLLVGGGDTSTDWTDDENAYSVNEVAINWNAALIYAVAGFLPGSQDGTAWIADGLVDAGALTNTSSPEAGMSDASAGEAGRDASAGEAGRDASAGEAGRDASAGEAGRDASAGETGLEEASTDASAE